MKISVIIPTWNRSDTLPRAIDSVLNQSHDVHELIVVDDGSTDNTASMLQINYPQVILREQSNSGVSRARNAGIEISTGDWIAFLDSDDEWLPNKLERQVQALQQAHSSNPGSTNKTRLCHCDEIWVRDGVRVNPHNKHKKRGGWIYSACLPLCAISPSAALLSRELLTDVGVFDESLPACEDYDLWLRICAVEPVQYLAEQLVIKYGGHDDQLSAKHWGMDRFRMVALAKMIESGTLSSEQLLATKDQLAKKLAIFSNGARKRGNLTSADDAEKRYLPLISTSKQARSKRG